MKDYLKIKKKLQKACLLFVEERLITITNALETNKKALFSETKSSAGDKHETSRAMLQLEMEKASQQLASINQMVVVLHKMRIKNRSHRICLGSLIVTTKATYFLAISAGIIAIDSVDYYIVSTNSPIGQELLGKKAGDKISFNQTEILSIF